MKILMKRTNVQFNLGAVLSFIEKILYSLISNPVYAVVYLLYMQQVVVSAFNKKTLENVRNYMIKNKENITWEVNESGFVRTRFPSDIINVTDPVFAELNSTGVSVRTNFWYNLTANLQDAAAHDHPNGFMSYVVSSGYVHAVYNFIEDNQTVANCSDYPKVLKAGAHCTQFSLINKSNKQVINKGSAILDLVDIHQAQPGNTIIFDDNVIHRILTYEKNALTLNIVRQDGKYNTNIFLFPDNQGQVKTVRALLKNDDALAITEKAIELYGLHLDKIEKSNAILQNTLRYEKNKYSVVNHSIFNTTEVLKENTCEAVLDAPILLKNW